MTQFFKSVFLVSAALAVAACSGPGSNAPLKQFQSHLQSLCGKTFEGRVTSTDPQDENWRKKVLTLGPVTCPNAETTVLPLAVGQDKSRVWTLTLEEDGEALDFRHAHTLKDGSPDPVTGYGGVATNETSTGTRAVFPVDEYSKANFKENGLDVSMTNTWSITVEPSTKMTYKLERENRNFVAEFDISRVK